MHNNIIFHALPRMGKHAVSDFLSDEPYRHLAVEP